MVPPGFTWPTWKGKPLSFLAQLDLPEVASAGGQSWLPPVGKLYFFYDQDQSTWGFDPADRGSWRVIYSEAGTSTLMRGESPSNTESVFVETPTTFRKIMSYPDWQRPAIDVRDTSDEEFEQLAAMWLSAFGENPKHQLFGFPVPVQGDSMELECQLASNGVYCGAPEGFKSARAIQLAPGAKDWRLLFQIDSDDDVGMMWGDVGTLYFWVRESDARASNFGDAWMILQCG